MSAHATRYCVHFTGASEEIVRLLPARLANLDLDLVDDVKDWACRTHVALVPPDVVRRLAINAVRHARAHLGAWADPEAVDAELARIESDLEAMVIPARRRRGTS